MEEENLSLVFDRSSPTEDHEDVPKSERYDFVAETREPVEGAGDTEMDDDIVQENVTETEE